MTPESGPSIDAASAPLAEAWSYNTNAVQDWLARQRAISAQQGLWNDETGLPTQAGVVNALQQWANGVQTGTIRAFHGSPYDFSAFDASKIGTGEGAGSYGHGLYFAEREDVAKGYRDKLAPTKGGTGHMYEVNLNVEPEDLLDWDKPMGQQSPQVLEALRTNRPLQPTATGLSDDATRSDVLGAYIRPDTQVRDLMHSYGIVPRDERAAALRDAGIPGVRYLDQGSRQVDFSPILHRDGSQTWGVYLKDRHNTPVAEFTTRKEAEAEAARRSSRNYVMFDPTLIEILRKYGIAGGMLGGAGALSESDKPSAESLTSPRDTNVMRSLAQ